MTIDQLTEALNAHATHSVILRRAYGDSTASPAQLIRDALTWAMRAHALMTDSYRTAKAAGGGDPARMARLRELLGD